MRSALSFFVDVLYASRVRNRVGGGARLCNNVLVYVLDLLKEYSKLYETV
jgi:hypothetical protein